MTNKLQKIRTARFMKALFITAVQKTSKLEYLDVKSIPFVSSIEKKIYLRVILKGPSLK